MKYINLFFFMLILAIAGGCADDFDYRVSDSVFIADNDNPGLPIYSEKGYNSFGVYWGLSPFTTERQHDPSKIVVKDDSCHIHLGGSMDGDSYTLVISLPEQVPTAFTELLSLNGKNFDLTGRECVIGLFLGSYRQNLEILEGSFTFKRAQNMYVDKELEAVVLSGVFSFKATINGTPETFSNGRFDMRFGNGNFFYLQGN